MAVSKRVAGIASILIDGSAYALVDGLTWSPSTVTRESKTGLNGVHGYSELPIPGYMAATIRDAGVTVADFNAMTASTIVVEQANHKQIIGALMWCVGVQEVDGAEGTFQVRFEGVDVSEVV
jgi:hypothetical protein